MSDIDRLLSGLHTATRALKASLDGSITPGAQPATAVQTGKMTTTPRTKSEIVHALMLGIERRFGIAPNDQVERKILRIFEPMSLVELEQWSTNLLSPYALESEWLALVECLTVHETYFNRDKDLMQMLQDVVLPELISRKQQAGRPSLRIWSSACSSGEEAYNLVMLALQALLKAGCALERNDDSIVPLPPWSLSVLGTDISSQVIRRAQNAIYGDFGMGSFRDTNPRIMRFFELFDPPEEEKVKGGRFFKVRRFVTDHTRFRRHNLLDMMNDGSAFDLIICRNVLIYFDDQRKAEVQSRLSDTLASGGVLVLGTTDVLQQTERYERRTGGGGFWYIKK
jgi:chemotaxis protein methyltransferase CheR